MIPLFEPNIIGNAWRYTKEALDSGWIGYEGPFVKALEKAVAKKVKTKHAIACNSGTAALHLGLISSGVKSIHEIIVPTVTFAATIAAVRHAGATPIFMDCDDYLNIDVNKVEHFCKKMCKRVRKRLINKVTHAEIKAIMPVDVFGTPCDMPAILEIANKYGMLVVEDSAEALGSKIVSHGYSGATGDIGVYSFSANKLITTGGGGILVTNNSQIAEKARYLAGGAKDDPLRYIHGDVGYNYKMSNLHAAIGLSQFELLEDFIKIKKVNYRAYQEEFRNIQGLSLLGFPIRTKPNYWFYGMLIDEKPGIDCETMMNDLAEDNIQTRPLWGLNHLQKPYRHFQSYLIEKAYTYHKKILNIPCSTTLTQGQIKTVVNSIEKLLINRARIAVK